jgi:hypothetical protein
MVFAVDLSTVVKLGPGLRVVCHPESIPSPSTRSPAFASSGPTSAVPVEPVVVPPEASALENDPVIPEYSTTVRLMSAGELEGVAVILSGPPVAETGAAKTLSCAGPGQTRPWPTVAHEQWVEIVSRRVADLLRVGVVARASGGRGDAR